MPSTLFLYAAAVALLLVKFLFTISVQAQQRLTSRCFRYPEDASAFRGELGEDSQLCQRAQALLRNDSESQVFFFPLGALYVAVGASSAAAGYYFIGYALLRILYGYWMLRPRQPHRNRAFALSLIVLAAMAVHVGAAFMESWG